MKTHFHWQNLSDAPGRERHGFWHGRAWLHLGERMHRVIHGEWLHGKLGAALSIRFDRSEREVMLHIAAPGFSYHVGFQGAPAKLFDLLPMKLGHDAYGGWEREIAIKIFDVKLWWSFWADPMCWSASDPWWMHATFDPIAFLFGKTAYASKVIEERAVKIPMPEKTYDATAKLEVATWVRPRWPWRPLSEMRTRVSIDIPGGIGVPGKGENDYDCGPDAIFGITATARTIEEGVGKVVADALETRRKRGWHWTDEVVNRG